MDSLASILSKNQAFFSKLKKEEKEPNLLQISTLKYQENQKKKEAFQAKKRLDSFCLPRVHQTEKINLKLSSSEEVYKPGRPPLSPVKFRNSQLRILKRLTSPSVRVEEVVLFEDKNLKIEELKTSCTKDEKKYLKISLENRLDVLIKIHDKRLDLIDSKRDLEFKYSRLEAPASFIYALGKEIFKDVKSGSKTIYVSRLIAHLASLKARREGKPFHEIKNKEVHHLNKDPLDNRATNLVVLGKACHERIHELKAPVQAFSTGIMKFKTKHKKRINQTRQIISMNNAGIIDIETKREEQARKAKEEIINLRAVRIIHLALGLGLISEIREGFEYRLKPGYDEKILEVLIFALKPSLFKKEEKEAFKGQVRGRIGDYFRARMMFYDKKSRSWKKAVNKAQLKLALKF
jgi:hypothetical protein